MTALLSLKLPDDINWATVYLLLAETARCPDVFAVQKLNERQLAALKKARETVEHNSLKKLTYDRRNNQMYHPCHLFYRQLPRSVPVCANRFTITRSEPGFIPSGGHDSLVWQG